MERDGIANKIPTVGNGSGFAESDSVYTEELQLALRNRGMPLEALRYPVTPTGMHYLLVHYDIPEVNVREWRLKVAGLVSRSLNLTLEEIKKRTTRSIVVTMECAGNGRALSAPRRISQPWLHEAIGTAEWIGTPLREILEEAGLSNNACEIVFSGLDQGVEGGELQYYERSLTVGEATREDVLLAYEMNGEPLQPQHGYPLRLVVPDWYGMASVKWLCRIEASAECFQGYQMVKVYRYSQAADEPGDAVTLMRVRALMIPPGIPDFLTRTRIVQAGPVTLQGRAWAGRLSVSRVEVSVNGGSEWAEAQLEEPLLPYAWRGWTFAWNATPGKYTLRVRATDSADHVQPLDQQWNFGGYGNNVAQRVNVIVQ